LPPGRWPRATWTSEPAARNACSAQKRPSSRCPSTRAPHAHTAAALSAGLPLYTINPDDFEGLGELIEVVPVASPA
jgi:hypothetical protein